MTAGIKMAPDQEHTKPGSRLTPKQEAFCRAYMENGGNASEAYRAAYDAKEMKPATINREAKALTDNPKITTRLAQLQRAAAERNEVSVDSLVQELEQARAKAQADSKGAAAMVSATIAKARILGLLTDRHELTGRDGKDLVPEVDTRDLARVIVEILSTAQITDRPQTDPEALLPAPSISAALPEPDIKPEEADYVEPVSTPEPQERPAPPDNDVFVHDVIPRECRPWPQKPPRVILTRPR